MILSNVAIHRALDQGRLRIEPEPRPRVATLAEPDCPYDTTSVDLRLGKTIQIPRKGPFSFDPSRGGIARFLADNSDEHPLDGPGGYVLKSHAFALCQTLELVELPIRNESPTLAARIEGKSSVARCGLLVHFTAPTVHAGWRGPLTLEVINLGPNEIVLRTGMRICQLVLETVEGTPTPNPSQFQGQKTPAGTAPS